MNPLIAILMRRDGLSLEEASDVLTEAQDLVRQGVDPEDVLREEFGLEPDYLYDLIETL